MPRVPATSSSCRCPRAWTNSRFSKPSIRPRTRTGLHPVNLGRLVLGKAAPLPCTPRGIVDLLRRYGVPIAGAEVVVVGRGTTVGRPLGLLLTRRSENATVTLCHTGTRDLAAHVRSADIVVAAAGVPGLITAEMVKPGAAVLDVGISRVELADGKDEARRRRRAGGTGGRRASRADARWRRPDDPCDVAHQRRRARRGSGVALNTGRVGHKMTPAAGESAAVAISCGR